MRRFLPAVLVATLVPVTASAQSTGAEFQVNISTPGYQSYPSVASYDSGFVVVWDGPGDGHGRGIFARRYDAFGNAFPVFQVNQYSTSYQWRPQVAADVNGGFVVTWQSYGQDGSDYGVFARRYDAITALGPEFLVNTSTAGRQRFPSVAMDPVGRFVIVWTGVDSSGTFDIFARAYDAFGSALGSEFHVNGYTTAEVATADVAMDGSGGFVVAWGGYDADASGVFARRFAPGATPLGGEIAVNTYTTDNQYAPSVAIDNAGNFLIAFVGEYSGARQVWGRRYSAAGVPFAPEFQVNSYTTAAGWRPDVAFDEAGDFVVAWTTGDAAGYDVLARSFSADSTPKTGDFRLNAYATGDQRSAALAFDGPDHFVATWMSRPQDGDGWGIFGRRFDPDRIFADGFETGGLSAWSSAAVDGGDLAVSTAAALRGSVRGLRGVVDDAAGLYVQDDTPNDEGQYRARFYLDPNGFDPGEASGARRTRIFIAFEENPTRRLAAVVLRRVGGVYAIMGRARLDDGSQYDTGFFTVSDTEHVVELAWTRSSGPDANDGRFELWLDGVSRHVATSLDNSRSAVDFVRLGALSVKPTAAGVLYWDEFDSRRITYIGP